MKLQKESWIAKFLMSQPENGMGYQKIEILLKDGSVLTEIVVLNCEEIKLANHPVIIEEDIIRVIVLHGNFCDNPNP